jgi:hypothetical protein
MLILPSSTIGNPTGANGRTAGSSIFGHEFARTFRAII